MNDTEAHGDWASQLVDSLDGVVDTIRAKTADPARSIVKKLIYGVAIGGVALLTLLVLLIALVRIWDRWVPGGVWIGYLALGLLLIFGGLIAWSKRHVPV